MYDFCSWSAAHQAALRGEYGRAKDYRGSSRVGSQKDGTEVNAGCVRRLREAISLECSKEGLALSDKAVLQALDIVRKELYLVINRRGREAEMVYG